MRGWAVRAGEEAWLKKPGSGGVWLPWRRVEGKP